MHCHQCGEELPQEVKFCSGCGAALAVESITTVLHPESSSHFFTRPWFVILGIVLVGVVVILAVVRGRDGQSIHQLTQQSESGDATAQRKLGYAYLNGEGVPKNDSEAARWTRKAAEQGDAKAEHNLGLMYDKGRGVPKDETEAARWFRKAAEQGLADAQNNLGTLYYEGRGVPRDYAKAAVWYRKAAEQGESSAQYFLGLSYFNGEGVPQDDAEAMRWYRKAAEQGNTGAQSSLGLMYAANRGVPKDDAEAYFWLSLGATTAVANDELVAGKAITRATLRDQVGASLTLEKRLEVQERCRKWAETHPVNQVASVESTNSASTVGPADKGIDDIDYVPPHQNIDLIPSIPKRNSTPATAGNLAQYEPGAFICPSYEAAQQLDNLYARHWEDLLQDKLTHGQSRLMRGEGVGEPNPRFLGCVVVASGTPATLEHGNMVQVVTATLPNDSTIRGVTLAWMFR
jgi:hypothetical protein